MQKTRNILLLVGSKILRVCDRRIGVAYRLPFTRPTTKPLKIDFQRQGTACKFWLQSIEKGRGLDA